jgi:putative CocE/NonD family hydrolase
MRPRAFPIAILWAAFSGQAAAQTPDTRTRFEKFEFRIPMRDGVRLYTAVYVPKEASTRYPMLLYRTRYGVEHYGAENYASLRELAWPGFNDPPYIFVWQDVRGSFLSEGTFVDMTPHRTRKESSKDVDQSTDTYDTIEWLVKNVPRNNGRVGLWGISYDGFFVAAGMIDAHPALVTASPQAPQADWFGGDDLHLHGALVLDGFEYFSAWGRPRREPTSSPPRPIDFGTRDGYRFYLDAGPISNLDERYFKDEIPIWSALMAHGTYDAFWKERNILPHLVGIRPAVMTVSGWFDANNLYGALHVYRTVEENSPGTVNLLVIGPWSHGQWRAGSGESLGDVAFGSPTAEFYRERILRPFFDSRLAADEAPALPEAYLFETGTNRWRTFDAWPPASASSRSLYLREGGALSFQAPAPGNFAEAFDEYVSDPAKPVPFIERLATDRTHDYMIQDQRFVARRPDVLVYQTEPLSADLTIAGPVRPSLWVSTTGTDSDFVVKLIDVYPDDAPETAASTGTGLLRAGDSMGGYQQLVRGDVMRGKFRDSLEQPEPFVPGEPTRIEFEMLDVLHTFRKGHRIMVQIQSSWFPLVDRNPQTFVDIYHASEADFRKATERVYRSAQAASYVEVNVLP